MLIGNLLPVGGCGLAGKEVRAWASNPVRLAWTPGPWIQYSIYWLLVLVSIQ